MDNIDLRSRYAAAWNEINARLQCRQRVLVAYAPLAVGGVTVALGVSTSTNPDAAGWAALFLPLFAASFALWTFHNDAIIGLLGAFCAECERQGAGSVGDAPMPAWHTPAQRWIVHGLWFRRLIDWGIALLFAITNLPLLLVPSPALLRDSPTLSHVLFAVALVLGVGSVALSLSTGPYRRKLQRDYAFMKSPRGVWTFDRYPPGPDAPFAAPTPPPAPPASN